MPFPTELRFIEAAESKLGIRLPESYRTHLLACNGGEIEVLNADWELYSVLDTSDKERTRRTAIDIVSETQSARTWRGFPPRAVAIGSDGCGNYLVFLCGDGDQALLDAAVFVWWHAGSKLEWIAEDFNTL